MRALTTEQVNFRYQSINADIAKTNATTPFILNPATDGRGVPPNLMIHKTNENLQGAPGGYAAPQPLTTYLQPI